MVSGARSVFKEAPHPAWGWNPPSRGQELPGIRSRELWQEPPGPPAFSLLEQEASPQPPRCPCWVKPHSAEGQLAHSTSAGVRALGRRHHRTREPLQQSPSPHRSGTCPPPLRPMSPHPQAPGPPILRSASGHQPRGPETREKGHQQAAVNSLHVGPWSGQGFPASLGPRPHRRVLSRAVCLALPPTLHGRGPTSPPSSTRLGTSDSTAGSLLLSGTG